MPDIQIPAIILQDVNKEPIRSQITIYPCLGIFHPVFLLRGGYFNRWLPQGNCLPNIAIQALKIHYIFEAAALWALVDKSALPSPVMFSAKELLARNTFATAPIPTVISSPPPQHNYSISWLYSLNKN